MSLLTAILVALLKTPGEGGAVSIPYTDQAACEAAGAELAAEITAQEAGNGVHPKVIWTCIPG
jgi:hypothetical protein